MKARRSIVLVLVLAFAVIAFAACKKKEEQGGGGAGTGGTPGTGTGTGTGTSTGGGAGGMRPSQGQLAKLEPLTYPDDPNRAAKVTLGHTLFFDKRLSVDGTRACYSCHLNEDGNGGKDPIAIGPGEKKLTRHSPVIWNVAYFEKTGALYWDGRTKTLDELAKQAWGGGNMAVGTEPGKLDAKAAEIAKIAGYKPLVTAAFPDVKDMKAVKADHIAQALAEYMRTLVCADTAYDKFAGGDKSALTEQQQKGLDVFMGKGQCVVCHAPPFFSTAMAADGGFYANTGVGTQGKPEAEVDIGRFKISNKPEDWASFKTPSLRNVAKSPPYFHDGSVAKLDEVVKIMATGGIANKAKSQLLADRGLSAEELADLTAFLSSLDCPGKLEEPSIPK